MSVSVYIYVSVYRHISASAEVDFCPHPDLIIWMTQPLECILSHLNLHLSHWGRIDLLAILGMLLYKHYGENSQTLVYEWSATSVIFQAPTLCHLHGGSWACCCCYFRCAKQTYSEFSDVWNLRPDPNFAALLQFYFFHPNSLWPV